MDSERRWDLPYPQVWFTYGPRTCEEPVLRELIEAGATGVRLTFSYGTPELQVERARQVKRVADALGTAVVIVADLQGEKCRLAKLGDVEEISVLRGKPLEFTKAEADPSDYRPKVPLQNPEYVERFQIGDIIIEGDGALVLEVIEKHADSVVCLPLADGVVHPGRGILVQNPSFRPAPLTPKDVADLEIAADSGAFDAVALSFVGEGADVTRCREVMPPTRQLPVIAKIETGLGIENIHSIVVEADAVMAARGDLALTRPWVELASDVRIICDAARSEGKPWILATQIVEGLEKFAFPTRAEICDLAGWIGLGAHGAMLSYETAFGPRAVEAVDAVCRVVARYSE